MGTKENPIKTVAKRVSFAGKFSKVYYVADTLDGDLEALKAFQDDFVGQLPKMSTETFNAYFGKFKIETVEKPCGP